MDKINEQQHLTELIDLYQNLIFSICCKMTGDYFAAEDLTQETFLSAYRHFDTFTGTNEKAWLCRIASNKCIDYLKSAAKRQIPSGEELFAERADLSPGPEERILEKETRTTLLTRCRKLKPPYDIIATLYFYEEKKADEIAREQNKNLKTVQTQIYRARAMLRKLYKKERTAYEKN
ncbi:MAG: sigma-70 family RNA polymerase sigma factor [Eubacterium sp.]|nr:sigma-70 family RNA polymerase sigma factor [Eubacterium sp.]